MARLNFVFPFLPTKPVGGAKNMYEFANRLAAKGHHITILYSIRRPFKKQKTPVWFRLFLTKRRLKSVNWFTLSNEITVKVVPEITDQYVPDADATLSTWWQMAYAVSELSESKGRKFNFIQDYELWTGQDEKVHASYSLPVHHIVIAKYLSDLVVKFSSKKPTLVNTPIDSKKFKLINPIKDRLSCSLIMMYSKEPRKGSTYGIQALQKLKKELPELKVSFFSVYPQNEEIPDWIEFYQRPDNLPDLYNEHAIFFSPSLGEGWGLPPAEAMACGCAVVCTDIGGHQDYAIESKTALLVEPKNIEQMVEKIKAIIKQSDLRIMLAQQGHEKINNEFNWETSVNNMESLLCY
jgi:glycosyltransferase involved in cell wall biosynthesis